MDAKKLVSELSVNIDQTLSSQLVDEYIELEDEFALRRWKHSELNGGRFMEVAARIVYSIDANNTSLTKSVDDCLKYTENNQVAHNFPDSKACGHIARVIRSVYKLRSQRGAVHVSPTYTANEIDSKLVMESVRWVLAEIVRIFITNDINTVESTIRSLARFKHPIIRMFDGRPYVQTTKFSTEEEVLTHLLFCSSTLSTPDLVKLVHRDASGIRKAIKKLSGSSVREIVGSSIAWSITDLGTKRAETALLVISGKRNLN